MDTGWLSLASAAVNMGFAVVVGIYLITKAIPKMQADHAVEVNEQRKVFLAELSHKRDEFIAELRQVRGEYKEDEKERRAEFRESLKVILGHCEAEGLRRDRVMQAEIVSMTTTVRDQGKVLNEIRELLVTLRDAFPGRRPHTSSQGPQ